MFAKHYRYHSASPTSSSATVTHWISRLAKQTVNSIVRASKQGGVLFMRKMDKLSIRHTEDPEAAAAEATVADQGLVVVFAGPRPIDKEYFATFRDIFPTTHALSDVDLLAATMHVNNARSVC